MADRRTVRTLGVAEPGRAQVFSYEEEPPGEGEVRVDTLFSGVSAGTELTWLKGTNPYLHATWDPGRGVFLPGVPSRTFPVQVLGYMEAARVVQSRAAGLAEGDLVAAAYGHRTGHVLDPRSVLVHPLPPWLDPLLGIYVAQMGPICANGLLHAAADAAGPRPDLQLADGVRDRRVLVTGGGVVGLLCGLLARVHGAAEVLLADPDPRRLAAAEALGLVPVPDDGEGSVWQACVERWRSGPADAGADLVLQCRGDSAVLATALRAVRPQGTVVDLAFYQGGAPQLRLGEEFHHKGLTVRCAQIGRVPRGLAPQWDRRRLADETLELLRGSGADVRQALVTDVVPFEEGADLLHALAARRRAVLQAVVAVQPS